MKKFLLPILLSMLIAAVSCDGGKSLTQTKQTAQAAYNSGDYTKALKLWEEVIKSYVKKSEEKQCPVYTEAGMAAMKLGRTEKAEQYLKQASWGNLSTAKTYLSLSEIYKEKDNLSLELEYLEVYAQKFPGGQDIEYVDLRLYELYVEIDSYDKALEFWRKLKPESQSGTETQELLIKVYSGLEMNAEAVSTAKTLLSTETDNIAANKWLANYYFWKAEKRYQKEMKIYKKKKTRKQYSHLLKVIDEVAIEFKQALKYGKKLYKLEPNQENAKLLGNTYDRLNYKDKAKYYQDLGKK
jgi:tetratricopeptide (TPR) repeat protein